MVNKLITEEKVTKLVASLLIKHDWDILSIDFPQSGSGDCFPTSQSTKESKAKGKVIPDIIAIKDNNILIGECKQKETVSDYYKIKDISNDSVFCNSILEKYNKDDISNIYFFVAFNEKVNKEINYNDFNLSIVFNVTSNKINILKSDIAL